MDQTNQKQRKKTNCSKGCDSVIFIQATPNGELARQFREVEESYPGAVKFKIVKKSVKSMLQKSNPWRNIGCKSAHFFSIDTSPTSLKHPPHISSKPSEVAFALM